MVKREEDRVLEHLPDIKKGDETIVTGDDTLDIVQLLLRYAESRNIILEHHGVNCEVNAGDKELLGVYFELLSKAFACGTGARRVSLRVSSDNISAGASLARGMDPKDRSIVVSVTGTGVAADALQDLFYSFCHAESRKITRAELKRGLSLTKVLIDFAGGSIRIENRESADDGETDTNFILMLHGAMDRVPAVRAANRSDSRIVIQNGVLNDRSERMDQRVAAVDRLKLRYEQVVNLERPNANDNPDDKFLCKLMTLLESNISDPEFNVSKLVNEIGMSRPVPFRKAKILTGSSIINLIRSRRLKMAEMLLKQNKVVVSEVAFKVGYNDPKYFSKSFRSEYGKTPTEFVHALRS